MIFGWGRKKQSHDSSRFGGYHIIKLVHEGRKAAVYQARRRNSEELCAIKLYRRAFDVQMRKLRRKYGLATEGEIGRKLNPMPEEDAAAHPIVFTLDEGREFDRSNGAYYVVQEFLDGHNLKNLITVTPGQLRPRRMHLAVELARGLALIHRTGYIHRDFAADNVLLTRAGHVKVIDLGFVAPVGMRFAERTGTPSYMAPEQIRGEALTPATDIYACGVILYELFTGRLPFAGPKAEGRKRAEDNPAGFSNIVFSQHLEQAPRAPRQLAPETPQAVEQVILRCLAKPAKERFEDGQALLLELRRCATMAPPGA